MSAGAAAVRGEESSAEIRGRPVTTVRSFAAAIAGGYRSAAETCFARESCLLTPDGTIVRGRGQIGAIIEQLTSRRTEFLTDQLVYFAAGDVTFAAGLWEVSSAAPEGSRFCQTCQPLLVLHRAEFEWKIAILAPWGIPGSASGSE